MAAYGSTTSIVIEKVRKLEKEIITLVKERNRLKKELDESKKDDVITTNSENVGPNPNRERVPVKTSNKKNKKNKNKN